MNENLTIYATLNRKAEYYAPEKCAVRKVIEIGSREFRELRCNLGKPNYIIKQNAEMMGYYNGAFNCILFLNSDGKDGILVNSEGADYARYSQYIPNARDIIAVHEQTLIFGELKNRMDNCIDGWLEHFKNVNKFDIPLTDLVDEVDFGEMFVAYVSERLSRNSTIENCEMTSNFLEITKRELVETRLYCPLKFQMDVDDDDGMYPIDIDSANYIDYDDEINEMIREDVKRDDYASERGLAAYISRHSVYLTKTSRTLDTNSNSPDSNQGGVAVITATDGGSEYIVRRLTLAECARLQGFPDWWCSDLGTNDPSADEVTRWQKIFDEYNMALGRKCRPKTENQIRAWLKKPHKDPAEFKMWGNGVALPCVIFVLAGIVYYNSRESFERM